MPIKAKMLFSFILISFFSLITFSLKAEVNRWETVPFIPGGTVNAIVSADANTLYAVLQMECGRGQLIAQGLFGVSGMGVARII